LTVDPLTNPVPFTVRVKAAPPAVAVGGAREVIEGSVVTGTLMTPPLPVVVVGVPSDKAPTVFKTASGIVKLLVDDNVTVITAATPLPMVWEFRPAATQVVDPTIVLHVSVLPAAVRTGPAAIVSEATSPEE
jgi:hypothetical protein